MGKAKKSTKKFKNTKLKETLERRNKFKETQKRMKKGKKGGAQKGKMGARRPEDGAKPGKEEEEDLEEEGSKEWNDMDDEDFTENGFAKDFEETSDQEDEVELEDGSDDEDGEGEGEEEHEDDDDAVPGDVKAHKRKLQSEVDKHKKELDELKKQDPEFFKFLQQNDKDLLDFGGEEDTIDVYEGESDDEAEGQEPEEEEEEDGAKNKVVKEVKKAQSVLTKEMVNAWEAKIQKGGSMAIRSLKKLLIAYRSGCMSSGPDAKAEGGKATGRSGYDVSSSAIFQKVMAVTFRATIPALNKFLSGNETLEQKILPDTLSNWKKIEALAKSFLMSTFTFLQNVTNASVITFVLKQLEPTMPYMACLKKISKNFLKLFLDLWSSGEDSVRIVSFLNLRKLAMVSPPPFIDSVLKGIYLYFVRNAKMSGPNAVHKVNFMQNCIVEMYGLDFNSSYQHAFVYIRQLAIHLRNAVIQKNKQSRAAVLNWQFINCLKIWAAVLGVYCEKNLARETGESPLQPLVYPLVQIVLGTSKLVVSDQYFPLRFHCIRMLNDLSERVGVFIPVMPHIIEIFDSGSMKAKMKGSTEKKPDLSRMIKVSKGLVGTHVYQDVVLEHASEIVLQYFNAHALSIAFPEIAVPVTTQLKKLSKKLKNVKMTKKIQQLAEKIDQNATFIEKQRNTVDFTPKDIQKARNFLLDEKKNQSPLRSYYNSLMAIKARRHAHEEMQDSVSRHSKKGKGKGEKGKGKRSKDDSDDSEEEEEDFEEEEEEEGEEVAKKQQKRKERDGEEQAPKKKQKMAKKPKKQATKRSFPGNGDDVVEDFDSFSSGEE